MAMENDVARIRAALNTPGLKYRSFGNQPVRGEIEPMADSNAEPRPVDGSAAEVTGAQMDAPAAAASEDPNDVTQKIDWAALAAMAAEPEPAPAVSSRHQPQPQPVSPAATPVAPPMAPQPLPIPTSQLLNLGAVPPPPSAATVRRSPDVAYALLDALAHPSPPAASPAAPPENRGGAGRRRDACLAAWYREHGATKAGRNTGSSPRPHSSGRCADAPGGGHADDRGRGRRREARHYTAFLRILRLPEPPCPSFVSHRQRVGSARLH